MNTEWLKDAAERVVSSFVETVIAAAVSGALASGLNASTAHVLLVAGLTAAAATVKTLLASAVPGVSPASLAPKKKRKRPAKKV